MRDLRTPRVMGNGLAVSGENLQEAKSRMASLKGSQVLKLGWDMSKNSVCEREGRVCRVRVILLYLVSKGLIYRSCRYR